MNDQVGTKVEPRRPSYQPVMPDDVDQGDPFLLAVPSDVESQFHYYVYTTGQDECGGDAFPVYGSNDLLEWRRLENALRTDRVAAHWAPCVRYVSDLPRPIVMIYSRAIGFGDEGHIGHTLRRADAERPEGPFVDSGHMLTPDLDFAIDADVYRLPDGSLKIAFAMDFTHDEPYGTGIVEADIDEALTHLVSPPRILARPSADWHLYDAERVMPWKSIPGVDWARDTVRWSTIEAPVGGLVSPRGTSVYLYSGGCFFGFYAVGAVIEVETTPRDVTSSNENFVIRPDPARGFYGPGHCSYLRLDDGDEVLMLHARFGSSDAPRQMCLAHLRWTPAGLPYAEPFT